MRPGTATIRRRRIGAVTVLVGVLAVVAFLARPGDGSTRVNVVLANRTLAKIAPHDPSVSPIPETITVTAGPARITYAVDVAATRRRVSQINDGGRTVEAVAAPVTATIAAPVVAQALPNNCETAALQVLLSTLGIEAEQLDLQAEVARDGPLDPVGSGSEQVWGDPEIGYVGRADGTGPAGGFGVYPGPIARLAAQRGTELEDLTGASTQTIYDRVLGGRAVMVWVGLDDGPYGQWTSPAGRPVRVNFNEHTVVITAVRGDAKVEVVNVLEGTRETWSRDFFDQRFERLGRRALAAPLR